MCNNKKIFCLLILFILLSNLNCFATTEKVCINPRNLIMFSSISYANLENILGDNFRKPDLSLDNINFFESNIPTDNELKTIYSSTQIGSFNLSGETENTYSYFFYNFASTNEVSDWKLVNYTKIDTTILNGTANFVAMTFKKDNDIVIAYRGTDFDDMGDWIQDGLYGLVGFAGQETFAQNYALLVASKFPNANIHLTGHSLGGYLAQIGGAYLLNNDLYKNNVKEITYFNGIGLFFFSNFSNNFLQFDNYQKKIDDFRSNFNKIQYSTQKTLTDYVSNRRNFKFI